jgi:hypothetical protein
VSAECRLTGDHLLTLVRRAWMNLGACTTGMILSCFLGLPLVLLHTQVIQSTAFWCWIASTIVGFIGIGSYVALTGEERTDGV